MQVKQSKTDISKPVGEISDKDKISDKRVLVYIPSYKGEIDAMTVEGLFYLLFDCFRWEKEGFKFFPVIGKRMFVQNARNLAVEHALEHNMDYILFVDDDMVIKADEKLFSKLLSHDKDIVAPLFFHRQQPYAPLIFRRTIRANGHYTTFDNILDYPKDLIEVDGVGFGCVLIKTEVFKKLKPPYFIHGDTFGEDLYFCNTCINAGFKIYCDTTINIGHIGEPVVSWEGTYKANDSSTRLFMKQKIEKDIKDSAKFIKEVDIIMPCYHNYKITREAIESIINNTTGVKWRLILINDGGDKNLEKYFKKLEKYRENISHITNKKNIGWIKSINQGLDLCKAENILFVNNDILVPPETNFWLERMAWALEPAGIGAVGPISNFVMGFQNMGENSRILLPEHFTKFLIGFCMMIKKEVVDKIGKLDERFGIGGNDDLDYSIRIREAGYKLKILRQVFIEHKGFKSLGKIYKDYKEVEDITRPKLIDKWGKEKVDNLFKYTSKTLREGVD